MSKHAKIDLDLYFYTSTYDSGYGRTIDTTRAGTDIGKALDALPSGDKLKSATIAIVDYNDRETGTLTVEEADD